MWGMMGILACAGGPGERVEPVASSPVSVPAEGPRAPVGEPQQEPVEAPIAEEVASVYFFDLQAIETGREPLLVPLSVPLPTEGRSQAAVDAVLAGPPGAQSDRLRTFSSGVTGARVDRNGDVVTVRLEGPCDSGGSTFTLDGQIRATLKALPGVGHVRVVGPGEKTPPAHVLDAWAGCLQP